MGSRTWVKIYCDKWLTGTLRQETPEFRGIWVDLLTLAGSGRYGDIGQIKFSDNLGYTDQQLSTIIGLSEADWIFHKNRFVDTERISVNGGNIITICNWKKYQSEYFRQLPYRSKVTGDSDDEKLHREQNRTEQIRKEKNTYKEYVLLTEEEYRKLQEYFGYSLEEWLSRLNDYIGSTGRRYKSHYHTLLNWARRDGFKPQEKPKPIKKELPPAEQDRISKEQVKELIKGIGK